MGRTLRFQFPFQAETHFLWSTSFQSNFFTSHFFSNIRLAFFLLALSARCLSFFQYFSRFFLMYSCELDGIVLFFYSFISFEKSPSFLRELSRRCFIARNWLSPRIGRKSNSRWFSIWFFHWRKIFLSKESCQKWSFTTHFIWSISRSCNSWLKFWSSATIIHRNSLSRQTSLGVFSSVRYW